MLGQSLTNLLRRRSENDPVFRQKSPDQVDDRCPNLNDLLSDPMEALKVLVFLRLDRGKGHIGTCHRFADRKGIIEVILVRLHERFHILGRNELHFMAHFLEFPGPITRGPTGLHSNLAGEESHQHLFEFMTSDHFSEDLFPFFVASDQMKDGFCQINPKCRNLHSGPSLILSG